MPALPSNVPTSLDHSKIGFEIGWDMAVYRLALPEDAGREIKDGYREGNQRAHSKRSDRYVRKWIRLRYNAWSRNRLVDETVTPAFLKKIDVPVCPITLNTLTHSTGNESDWSVDRLNNNGGYAFGNLAVMSTKANLIKWSMTLDEIMDRAYGKATSTGELSRFEWARMAALIAGACTIDSSFKNPLVVPMVLHPPPHTPLSSPLLMQCLLMSRRGRKLIKQFCPQELGQQSTKLCRSVEKKLERLEFDCSHFTVWHNPMLFQKYCEFYEYLGDERAADMIEQINHSFSLKCDRINSNNWALDSNGYLIE